ncbi:uncharacterized protein LOC123913525 [Trifolium pratense]|uniref:uncharacterized protein LOC123913525 n=1 Tax=Trifolium pratense TaxID=57577 RepID=UPI001E6954AD|nr:uncharacterized protein LOC123913525 [Trifolium pratense]
MSELYNDPLPSTDAPTPVINPAEENADTSGKTSVNLGLNVENPAETLGLKDPAMSEKLGKTVPNPPTVVDANIGSLYKILSKLLANRLKRMLGKLISNCQSAFLPQRQILDEVVVLNEIIDLAKRRKDDCILFKVDFERAYDSVNWGLSGMMRKAVEIGRFKGFQVNDRINFQLLQFADDTILTGKGVWDNLWTIKVMLRSFELVSRMRINFVKSKLYGLNIDSRLLEAGSTFLSCRSDILPFKFFGILVGANPRRKETWKPVVEAMSSKLNRLRWNGQNLEWNWQWCEELPSDEDHQLHELKDLLQSFFIHPDRPDRWRWILSFMGLFTVKFCYDWLLQSFDTYVVDFNVLKAIQQLWKNNVPSKINIFGWRLLLEKS